MDKILIIQNPADDKQINEFAYQFALQNGKDIIEAKTIKAQQKNKAELQPVVSTVNSTAYSHAPQIFKEKESIDSLIEGLILPKIKTIDVTRFSVRELTAYINKENCALVISTLKPGIFDLQAVLDQLNCPMMLLPEGIGAKEVKRIVYLTDLRYCQQPVVGCLSRLNNSSLLLAHICQQGLLDLTPDYGNQLFSDTFGRYSSCTELFFSQIKETNIQNVVDTLVHTMGADMLVCINRRFHFQQLLGDILPKQLPNYISVPVLIFPC
jgi:hypothetical protein